MSLPPVTIVGAGLAGSECAWQLAERGVQVTLIEQRPDRSTPAHQSAHFAELVLLQLPARRIAIERSGDPQERARTRWFARPTPRP